jgi:hypothetical protein
MSDLLPTPGRKAKEKKADEQKKQLLEIKSFLLKAKVSSDFWLSDNCTNLWSQN